MNRNGFLKAEVEGIAMRGSLQDLCWHMQGIVGRPDGGQTIIDRDNADLLDTMGGYKFNFCPICGRGLA